MEIWTNKDIEKVLDYMKKEFNLETPLLRKIRNFYKTGRVTFTIPVKALRNKEWLVKIQRFLHVVFVLTGCALRFTPYYVLVYIFAIMLIFADTVKTTLFLRRLQLYSDKNREEEQMSLRNMMSTLAFTDAARSPGVIHFLNYLIFIVAGTHPEVGINMAFFGIMHLVFDFFNARLAAKINTRIREMK